MLRRGGVGWRGEGEQNEERENEMKESQTGDYGDGSSKLGFFFFKY